MEEEGANAVEAESSVGSRPPSPRAVANAFYAKYPLLRTLPVYLAWLPRLTVTDQARRLNIRRTTTGRHSRFTLNPLRWKRSDGIGAQSIRTSVRPLASLLTLNTRTRTMKCSRGNLRQRLESECCSKRSTSSGHPTLTEDSRFRCRHKNVIFQESSNFVLHGLRL